MDQFILDALEQFGAVGVALLMLLENIFPPIPSELIMTWAGYSVSQGKMSFTAAIVAGSLGSFAGAIFWYYVAVCVGKERLDQWIEDHGVWLTISHQDLDRVERWFEKWGMTAVFGCRMIPGLRTLISVPAGFVRMPFVQFASVTACGTVIWTTLLVGIGWWLGENYAELAGVLSWISVAVVLGMFAWWLWRLVSQRSPKPSTARRPKEG